MSSAEQCIAEGKTYWNKEKKKKRLPKNEMKSYCWYMQHNHPNCQICGYKADDLHHLFYGSYGADKDDRYLISVCRDCHKYCHDNKHQSKVQYIHIANANYQSFKEQE